MVGVPGVRRIQGGPQAWQGGQPMAGDTMPQPGQSPQPNGTVPRGTVSQFGTGNNLVGSQINPTDSRRTQTAGTWAQNAASGLANWQPGSFQSVGAQDTTATTGALSAGNAQMQGMATGGYRPVAGTDLSGAKTYMANAGAVANQSVAPTVSGGFGYGGDTGAARGMGMDQLKRVLADTPDRGKLAGDAYSLLLEREAPQAAAEDRRLAQKTAALGRVGSGMFNSEQMDLATSRERTRDQARRELATSAAGMSLQDQLDKLGAAQGFGSALAGQDTAAGALNLQYGNAAFDQKRSAANDIFGRNMDLSNQATRFGQIGRQDAVDERAAQTDAERYGNDLTAQKAASNRQYGMDVYGIGRDQRNDQVNERDSRNTFDQQQFTNRRGVFGDLSGYETTQRGYDAAKRDELRGERAYQADQDQRAIDNAVRQRTLEETLYGNEFDRASGMIGTGNSQNPYDALLNGATAAGQRADAANTGAADLFGSWAQARARGRAPATRTVGGVDAGRTLNNIGAVQRRFWGG